MSGVSGLTSAVQPGKESQASPHLSSLLFFSADQDFFEAFAFLQQTMGVNGLAYQDGGDHSQEVPQL